MKKFVMIMVSVAAACLIIAVVLTAVNRGQNVWERPDVEWDDVVENFGGEVDQIQTASLEELGDVYNIFVRSSSDNIRVHYGDEGEVRVHYHGTIHSSRRNIPAPTLQMEQTKDGVSFWLESPRVSFTFFYSRNTVLDVYLPASYGKDLDLDASSGNIEIAGYTLHELSCKASSGRINIRDVDANTVAVDTSSGDISVEGITGGYLQAEATSGAITGEDIAVTEINLKTSSGDMRLSGVQGDIKANASSGAIKIEKVANADKVDCRTSSGDIRMAFENMGADLQFDTSSGSVKLAFPQDAAFGLRFDTSSGSFHSDFPITMTKTERNLVEGYVGDSQNQVLVHTSSGDCNIKDE